MYEANPKTINPGSNPEITGAMPRGGYEQTPFKNFEGLAAKLLKVPKEEMNERRIEWKESRKRKQD